MKKIAVLMAFVLVLALVVAPALALMGNKLDLLGSNQSNQEAAYSEPAGMKLGIDECTVGVNHASVTTHDSPVLWKVRDVGSEWDDYPGVCMSVQHYSKDDWNEDDEWKIEYDFIGITLWMDGVEEDPYVGMGLNEAGLGSGHSGVFVGNYQTQMLQLMFHMLGNYENVDGIRSFIESGNSFAYDPMGCFPFIDRDGNASMFELDSIEELYWEYDTMAPARADQGLLGFVVRANEFHKQDEGKDDTSITGRYLTGIGNTLGLINVGEFDEQSVVQGDNSGTYQLIRASDSPWGISNQWSRSAVAIQGAAPGEDPALATMWALLGNPSFSIAVPTWVAVSAIPEPIGTCLMNEAVTSLYNLKWFKEETVQAAVLPAEAHLFAMVNERLLPHWRALGGAPDVDEMTRVEHQMAWDAYRVVNYLATAHELNLAPAVDFEAQYLAGSKYKFNSGAADADGRVASYAWNFGDGETSTKAVPVHEFPGAGVYLVSLTVADDDGVTTTAWRYLTVPAE